MNVSRRVALLISLFALAGSLTLGGCNSSTNSPSQDKAIIGAGSTFVNPIMSHWVAEFQSGHPGVQINYQSIGSGGGIQQLKKGLVDFGASDAALTDQQLNDMPPLVQIPESAGPVCITYNLPGLNSPLRLSPETLGGIYLGTIKTWEDPKIKKDNPGEKLPKTGIVVAHRSDGSGTSNIFTTYLAAVSPEWAKKVGSGLSVSWPVGVGGKGSEGVTGSVRQMAGAIGYVELSYATENKLPVAEIRNAAGEWVAPTAAGATMAIDAFRDQLAQDVRTPVVNPPASAKDAYPISGLTYLLVPKRGKTAEKEEIVKQFVQFIITDGQAAAEGLQYSKLPESLVSQDDKLLGELQTGGNRQASQNLPPK